MKLVDRKNIVTGATEKWIQTHGTILELESTSKTSKGLKKFGHFAVTIKGKRSTGIAWDGVCSSMNTEPGVSIQVEASLADIKAEINTNWKVSLPTADSLSEEIANFVANL